MAAENQTFVETTLSIMNTTVTLSTNDSEHSESEWVPPNFDPSGANILMAVVLTALVLVTLFGNLIVLVAFLVDTKLRQPFNLFIMNLAVTDFLVAITAMPFYTIDTLLGYWPFGQLMCGVWIYFDFAMTFASVFTMVAISIDRFWCVTWAIHYKNHNALTKTLIFLAIVWLCVFSIWTPPFIADRNANEEVHFCIWEPNENRQFVLFVAVVGHYVPCIIMVGCYVKVFVVMRHQSKRIATNTIASMANSRSFTASKATRSQTVESSVIESEGTNGPKPGQHNGVPNQDKVHQKHLEVHSISAKVTEQDKYSGYMDSRMTPVGPVISNRSRDKKIFITLTYVIGSYLICWFPFYILFDTYAWKPELVPSGLYSFFFWMSYVNSTLNPFIYAYTSKDFRSAFARVIRCAYSCTMKE